jgi:hypothetical protein
MLPRRRPIERSGCAGRHAAEDERGKSERQQQAAEAGGIEEKKGTGREKRAFA